MSKKTELVDEIVALELLGKPAVSETERDALVKKYRKKPLPELQAVYEEQSKALADATADLVEQEPALGPLPAEEEAKRATMIEELMKAMQHTDGGPLAQKVYGELRKKTTAELEEMLATFLDDEPEELPDPKDQGAAAPATATSMDTSTVASSSPVAAPVALGGVSTVVISGAVFSVPAF